MWRMEMASMEGQKKENQPKGIAVQMSQDREKKSKRCSKGAREELGVSYRACKNSNQGGCGRRLDSVKTYFGGGRST